MAYGYFLPYPDWYKWWHNLCHSACRLILYLRPASSVITAGGPYIRRGILYLEEFVSCCKALFAGVAGQPACTVVKVWVAVTGCASLSITSLESDFGEKW